MENDFSGSYLTTNESATRSTERGRSPTDFCSVNQCFAPDKLAIAKTYLSTAPKVCAVIVILHKLVFSHLFDLERCSRAERTRIFIRKFSCILDISVVVVCPQRDVNRACSLIGSERIARSFSNPESASRLIVRREAQQSNSRLKPASIPGALIIRSNNPIHIHRTSQ